MRAASAIGDDTLQRAGGGAVVPESFTHGSAAQRQEALMRGFNGGGNPQACADLHPGHLGPTSMPAGNESAGVTAACHAGADGRAIGESRPS